MLRRVLQLVALASSLSLRLTLAFSIPKHAQRLDPCQLNTNEQLQIEGISSKGVRVTSIEGLRGVVATESLSSKNPVVEVNSELVLEITNTRQPSPFPDFCPQSLWESLKWDERLAFKLLHLKHIDKTSPLKPWILTLPSSFSTPFTWKDEDLEDLQLLIRIRLRWT